MVSSVPLEGIVDFVKVYHFTVVIYQPQYYCVISVFDDVAVFVR